MRQTERVLEYMREFGSITTAQAFTDLGVARLASRIHDLREQGHDIKREMVSAKNSYGDIVHFARYSLENDSKEA